MARPDHHLDDEPEELGFGEGTSTAPRLRESASEYEPGFERGLYKDVRFQHEYAKRLYKHVF